MKPLLFLLALAPALALAETPSLPPPVEPPPALQPAPPPAASMAPASELPPPPAPPAGIEAAPDATAALTADLPPPPPPPAPGGDNPWPRFGMKLEAGVPDAAVVALLFRPVPWLRLSAGPAWNYIGWGVQVGAGWTPIRWAISPTLNVEYGHFFDADASRFVKAPTSSGNTDLRPLLKKVGYDYWSAQVGLEFGSQRSVAFSLRGGLSYFTTAIHGAGAIISGSTGGGDTQVAVTDPKVRAVIPSAKLGFQVFF